MTAQEKKEPIELWIGWEDGENPEVVFDVDESDPRGAKKFIEYEAYRQARLGDDHNAKAIEILTQERDAAIAERDEWKSSSEGWKHEAEKIKQDAQRLAEAVKAAQEMHKEMSEHISKAEYTIEELKHDFDIGEPLRDGLLAFYKIQFEDALKAWHERNGK